MSKGSLALVFSTLTRRDALFLIPGIVLAIVSGIIPAIMAKIIGEAFNHFAYFNPTNLPISEVSEETKKHLRDATFASVWHLCLLGVSTMILSTVMVTNWIVIGEKVARGWRIKIYEGFGSKDMKWFDKDLKEKAGQDEGSGGVGSGGIMAKFARETDEVRIASGQIFGQSLEISATIIASLILAFISCWSLTLVVLASIPCTAVVVGWVQSRTLPLHQNEMENMARASNILERCIQSVTTIKAFTAEEKERDQFMKHVDKATQVWNRLGLIYGGRLGLSATLTLVMFTSGFWYGSSLVQKGHATPGSIITTFWSCLLVGNSLASVLTTLNLIEIGKVSAASLSDLISASIPDDRPDKTLQLEIASESGNTSVTALDKFSQPGRSSVLSFSSPSRPGSSMRVKSLSHRHVVPMRKIRPSGPFHGEVNVQNLTFSYPSRPHEPVLKDVSMFFPTGEMTFIIGGSGSGKSTLAHLLLRLYDDYTGDISLDEHSIRMLDAEWTRSHVAALDQSAIIFDMSISDNVALGRCGTLTEGLQYKSNHVPLVDRSKIIDACKMALLHNDISNLDHGYDTLLGSGGVDLSGGQKQRLALARAIIRDPTVLILDECTSALDVKSRTLITAFIKEWRKGKTTIMITHDLSQVESNDFVYLLEKGQVVEQGYRKDLGANKDAQFAHYVQSQGGGIEDDVSSKEESYDSFQSKPSYGSYDYEEEQETLRNSSGTPTGLEWEAKRALRSSKLFSMAPRTTHARTDRWASRLSFDSAAFGRKNPLLSVMQSEKNTKLRNQQKKMSVASNWSDVSSSTTLSSSSTIRGLRVLQLPQAQQEKTLHEQQDAKEMLELASVAASVRRPDVRPRKAWEAQELASQGHTPAILAHDPNAKRSGSLWSKDAAGFINEEDEDGEEGMNANRRTLTAALKMAWITQPNKLMLTFGLLITVAGAAVQPSFSFVLGKLLSTMGQRGQSKMVLIYSLVVLGLAFIDGLVQFGRFSLLQYSANVWIRSLRHRAFTRVFSQDKAWFDREENNSAAILTKIIKDGEDAKAFISRIIGELLLVVVLIMIVFVWSLLVSWQLTLAGAVMVPIFFGIVVVQSRLINRFERQNKLQRERVAKRFYNMLHNIRGIRSMSLERVFKESFQDAVVWVEQYGMRSAPLSGFGYGLKDACVYFAQALLYIVGSVLLIQGKLHLSGMLIVFNLLLFAVAFSAEIMAFLPGIAKSLQSIFDLVSILNLDDSISSESSGKATPYIYGAITFHNVEFSYPTRRHEKVLNGCSFEIYPGERVALVGHSGCGKSTVAALLSRMYEPDGGFILLDNRIKLSDIRTDHLRSKIAFVQQRSDLFDDTIRNNILYGNPMATQAQLDRALKASCSEEIISKLSNGIDTSIGDKASSISGGQRQRLALARALIREDAPLLVLDECTSALDPQNQEKVAENLLGSNSERKSILTTIVITHKLEMMKRCDRILVLEKGKVVQNGHFDELLLQKGGAFSKLANAGEWGA